MPCLDTSSIPVFHSSILAWETPWTEEPGRYNPKGRKESDTTEWLSMQDPCSSFFY